MICDLVPPQSKLLATPMPLVVHALLQLIICMTKKKSLRNFFEWIIIYHYNIARGNVPYFPLLGPNQLTKFNLKMQDFKHVLYLNCE